MIIRILIAALFVFYLAMLYIIRHPQVSDLYAAYYITRTSDIPPGEIDSLKSLNIPARESSNSTSLAFDSWHEPEDTHRWAEGVAPAVVFRLDEESRRRVSGVLSIRYLAIPGQSGGVYLNGYLLENAVFAGAGELNLTFDRNILSDVNKIEFKLTNSIVASKQDPRVISLALTSLSLE